MKKSDFYYELPDELIAQQPLAERSASRLLCLDKNSDGIEDRHFTDLLALLNKDDLLVLNNTKVIPARLFGHKQSGGKVEILIERVLNEREVLAHMRSSKSPKAGALIRLDAGFQCLVLGRVDDLFHLQFQGELALADILEHIGHMPLPPYIERADNINDQTRYQTVFAQKSGAVAAPTAGLHFDDAMMDKIRAKGGGIAFVTLHVASGTFRPVKVENLAEHVMHKEYFEVPQETVAAVQQTKSQGGRVIAIGTTAMRSLESASRTGELHACQGDTDLFITPGYQFKTVDAMLTNFHLPESTLLMLVSAFSGYERIKKVYQHAIAQKYRFFSYGDAMFIQRE
ncbi:S-adenosylmethionine:tRNA ribosyltransferase-isomerase [Bathymodiolus platifrons methanotrophic gill symbiont]|uniref:tRNA preQ1(34) S-adenosylmethionine ribosyltransferase-isomerase QueA n=1 Tax=Bathymodiolus platifrons methanotrophic gill symbiont TaxID=113268 RepID=UPI000B413AF9|nr:tRNA preQ1(34) S-adenosylmethionine ribosyltransferase-isomerase QueA [Bathymodiolus platifrons methanotrophic gill symbiont]GAW85677.1 S-adenosylmethionine:tRNA ribosyltransferase-isomerase [Bathymodiolus platifrons methanotrophic gill symbiont]GFO76182.1 S-adenosylmethionine:tRNA ribosyltransferase-isomerase [Bathymodiolus platifrons methanotrophic gill symbiont]